jgi:hypothetical protein
MKYAICPPPSSKPLDLGSPDRETSAENTENGFVDLNGILESLVDGIDGRSPRDLDQLEEAADHSTSQLDLIDRVNLLDDDQLSEIDPDFPDGVEISTEESESNFTTSETQPIKSLQDDAVGAFFKDMGRYPLLKPSEEIELAREVKYLVKVETLREEMMEKLKRSPW